MTNDVQQHKALYASVWRWHFYAGLYVAPFLVVLACTGLVMLARDPIDRWQLGDLLTNTSGGSPVSHQARLDAARTAFPNATLVRYQPGRDATDATRVTATINERPQTIFVDATTGAVRGVVEDRRRIYVMAHLLHGTLLLGNWGDALIEIAASLSILSIVSGLYLWFPKGRSFRQSFRISGATPRLVWRDVHKIIGVILAPVLALQLIAGLAWTEVWGGRFVQTWSTLAVTNAAPGQSASHHETLNAGSSKVVPWNLEQTPLPSFSPRGSRSDHARCCDCCRSARGYWPAVLCRRADAMQMASGPSHKRASTMTSMIRGRNSRCTWIGTRGASWAMEAGKSTVRWRGRWPRESRFIWVRSDGGISPARVWCACRCIALSVSGLVMWWLRRPARGWRLAAPPRPDPRACRW